MRIVARVDLDHGQQRWWCWKDRRGEVRAQPRHPMARERTLLVVHHRDRPTTATPEQRRLGERGHQRFERRRNRGVVVDQSHQHVLHMRTLQLPQDRYVGRHCREEAIDGDMVDQTQPLRPRHPEERVQELGFPREAGHGLTVITGQARARAVRRLDDKQLDHPAGDVPGLVDDVDVRMSAQGGEEPFERRSLLRTQQQVGLVLRGRAPTEPGPQYGDQLGGIRYGEIDAGLGDRRRRRA